MQLKEFVEKCLKETREGITSGADFVLADSIHFDIPLSCTSDNVTVARGDAAKLGGLPRSTFDVSRKSEL